MNKSSTYVSQKRNINFTLEISELQICPEILSFSRCKELSHHVLGADPRCRQFSDK